MHSKRRLIEDRDAFLQSKKRRISSPKPAGLVLLDLPNEVLSEVFCLAANASFAETCKTLCLLVSAVSSRIDGTSPPLWLQERFIANMNPYFPFALEKAIRRRFCTAATLKYCSYRMRLEQWQELTIPLRLIIPPHQARRRVLFAELACHGVPTRPSTMHKALVMWAGHPGPAKQGLSLYYSDCVVYDRDVRLAAFKSAARHQLFGAHESFAFLAETFGFGNNVGQELMAWAVKRQDMQTVSVLQDRGVVPDIQTLNKLVMG